MGLAETMEQVARGVEVIGIVTLVVGMVIAIARAGGVLVGSQDAEQAYRVVRTVAVEPSLENVAVLGVIVLIRTFLSFSLEVEIDGTWPWRRATASQAGATSPEPDRR